MNELDYAVAALAVISIGVGLARGAVREAVNLAAWVLAFGLAYIYARDLAAQYADWMADPAVRVIMAWLTIFVCVMLLASMVASLLSGIVEKIGLGGLNTLLGAAIGTARAGLVLVALALVAGMTKFPQSALWKNAASAPVLETAALHARAFLPESLASKISFRPATAREAAVTQDARDFRDARSAFHPRAVQTA